MNNQTYGDWSALAAPFVDLQKISQEAGEKVVRECISYYSDNTGTAIKCMQTLPRITSPEDFVATNMKIFAQQGEKALEFTQNVLKICQDAYRDQYQWTEDKVNTAVKSANKAVKKHGEAAA